MKHAGFLIINVQIDFWNLGIQLNFFLPTKLLVEKTKCAEDLLFLMRKIDTKAYFLFLKYILNQFNAFNAFFQETRIETN